MAKPLTDAQDEQIKALLRDGKTDSEIAKELHFSKNTVRARRFGILGELRDKMPKVKASVARLVRMA